ncbi:equilibrative nucleotide transporter 8-like [Rutidosis leptorrhynchoides]|uniref:equilibrative nucleotide transporter 8-like n=1 Tax=Rutidosis leptorrhynchoides TaxID=125765 RepID=UPI003A98E829
MENQVEPNDPYHITYMIHFLLGAGYLVPWNSFITAVDYFQHLYPSRHVSKVFSVAYMMSATIMLFVLTYLSSKMKLPGFKVRLNMGYGLFVLALMVAPVTGWIDHGNGSGYGFVVLVLMVALTGLAEGLTSGSLIGATGKLPERYMQAVVAGNASAGVLVCMLRIVTKASLPHSRNGLRTSTHIYFFTSTCIELLCIVFSNLLHKLQIVRHYTTKELDDQPKNDDQKPKTRHVLKKLKWLAISVVLIYVVTLSIFPGYLSENVKSVSFGDWYPVFLITIFNAGDFSGKCLTAIYVVKRSKWVIWGCVGRVLFYPLFMGCVFGPKWLRNEVMVTLLTLLLGLSNGYLTSVIMIVASKSVPVEESNVTGIIISLFLAIGLVIGSALGWLWNIRA